VGEVWHEPGGPDGIAKLLRAQDKDDDEDEDEDDDEEVEQCVCGEGNKMKWCSTRNA
jgi:hypothetical protein